MTSLQIAKDDAPPASLDPTAAGVTRYVIVEMNASSYGFPTDSTIELMSSSAAAVTRVPKCPRYVRGVINHRGSIIPVVDTRALLGLPTAEAQARKLVDLLAEREREHVAWLDALEHAIRTGEPFEMQTDPTRCAFGRWYKETTTDPRKMQTLTRYDQSVRTAILDMDAPHKRIHRLADTLLALRADGKTDEAIERLNHERATTLEELRALFKKVTKAVNKGFRSMLVISELGDRRAAFEVDAVHTVKDCAEDDIEALPETATCSEFMRGLVHQPDGTYVLVCDLARMYELACPR